MHLEAYSNSVISNFCINSEVLSRIKFGYFIIACKYFVVLHAFTLILSYHLVIFKKVTIRPLECTHFLVAYSPITIDVLSIDQSLARSTFACFGRSLEFHWPKDNTSIEIGAVRIGKRKIFALWCANRLVLFLIHRC